MAPVASIAARAGDAQRMQVLRGALLVRPLNGEQNVVNHNHGVAMQSSRRTLDGWRADCRPETHTRLPVRSIILGSTRWSRGRGMGKSYSPLLVLALVGLCGPAWAQQQAPPVPPPAPPHPAIEPGAIARLKALCARLGNAQAMSFTAVTTYEFPARNGQPLWYHTVSHIVARRPDKLQVITPADGPPSEFYYDGKQMVVYAPDTDLVAVASAPRTIDGVLKFANQTAAIYFPFGEVLYADPYANLSEGLRYAYYVGQSAVVGDTVTDMIALENERVDAEIWIGVEDGLPRMIRATFPADPTKARYEIQFSDWRLGAEVKSAAFTTRHLATSRRMQFRRPDAPAPPVR